MALNAFFKVDEKTVKTVAGYNLHPEWWSRPYEYAWALDFARTWHTAADMGCGWMYRPLKDALAEICQYVIAVDADKRLLRQPRSENMEFIVADITQTIPNLESGLLDSIFCISVLEDLGDMAQPALSEFRRVLKDSGRIMLTFDVPYDENKPTPTYPGLPLDKFENAMFAAGLKYLGSVDYSKENAVNHPGWNLCVFHCVLEKA